MHLYKYIYRVWEYSYGNMTCDLSLGRSHHCATVVPFINIRKNNTRGKEVEANYQVIEAGS